MELDERQRITLGALFHDIGKVVQRADQDPRKKTHQEFGHDWIKKIFKGTPFEELSDFALYHHFNPKYHPDLDVRARNRNDLLLVAHADNLSSGEREQIDYSEDTFDIMRPIKSIFSSIGGKPEPTPAFYSIRRLSEGLFYPVHDLKLTPDDYQRLLHDFENTIVENTSSPNTILDIFEEYFSLIPSHTAEADGVSTDVSLFDHLKTTSAIALAAYNYLIETHDKIQFSQIPTDEITNTKTKRYLLIGVDISGIQNFIYTISSKGALKLLRARSFYIEMLLEFVAMRLIKELHLYYTNLLFLGGGNFIILSQNTDTARKTFDLIIHDFNDRLFDEHHGKLWLSHGYVEFEGEAFLTKKSENSYNRTIADILDELHQKINGAKSHKFASFNNLDRIFDPRSVDGRYECEVCGAEIKKEDAERDGKCPVCRNLSAAGSFIHKAKYVAYRPKNYSTNSLGEIEIYRGEKLEFFDKPIDSEFIWVINPATNELVKSGITLYMGNYPRKSRNFDPDMEEKESPSFNYFGAKLVGTLRMDVDNLGYIFSKGFSPEKRTISRLSTLSRYFNLFFRRFVNNIAQGKLGNGVKQFSVVHPGVQAPREVVIVYAGGDDLFIVGAWHDVIEMAFDIRRAFRKFVGGDHITISGGLSLNHLKHPIHLFAKHAGDSEKEAKDIEGKNAFTAFGRAMKWDIWEYIIYEDFLKIVRENFYSGVDIQPQRDEETVWGTKILPNHLQCGGKNGELPRTFIYRIMQISDVLYNEGIRLKPYALLAFILGRHKTLRKEPFLEWLNIAKSFKTLRNLKPGLVWLDLLGRKNKKEVSM